MTTYPDGVARLACHRCRVVHVPIDVLRRDGVCSFCLRWDIERNPPADYPEPRIARGDE